MDRIVPSFWLIMISPSHIAYLEPLCSVQLVRVSTIGDYVFI